MLEVGNLVLFMNQLNEQQTTGVIIDYNPTHAGREWAYPYLICMSDGYKIWMAAHDLEKLA